MTSYDKMITENSKSELKKIIKTVRRFYDSIRNTCENISKIMPKIKPPNKFNFNLSDISKVKSWDITREKNNWERHKELMSIQDEILKIQEGILKEQKSTSKMTRAVLILTVISISISIIALFKAFLLS